MPAPVTVTVLPSGRMLLVQFADPTTGLPAVVRSLLSADERQRIAIGAQPTAGTYTLSDGTNVSDPIPVSIIPPATYGCFTLPVIAGHRYRVDIFTHQGNPDAVWHAYDGAMTVDGSNILATLEAPQGPPASGSPGTITDGTTPDGRPAVWRDLGPSTGITPTGSTLTLRVTGSDATGLAADGVRLEDLTAGTPPAYVDDRDGQLTLVGDWISLAESPDTSDRFWQGTAREGSGHGNANRVACDPAAIQAALQSLASIGAGNIAVSAEGQDQTGPFDLAFTGALAGRPVPLLGSSDPTNVVISETSLGGRTPSLAINGGAPIPLRYPIWQPGFPFVLYWLGASAPAVQHRVVDQAGMFIPRGRGFPIEGGYSGAAYTAQGAAPGDVLARWEFVGLPPTDTFRAAVTWIADPSYSANATYTVKDAAGNVVAGPFVVSQKVAPASFTAEGRPWHVLPASLPAPADGGLTVELTNGDGDVFIIDAVRLERTSADAGVYVAPGDTVTFTATDGWVTTDAGPLPAAVALAADNHSGADSLVPFDPTPKTMPVGYNVMGATCGGPVPVLANVAKNAQLNESFTAIDAVGNPTRFSAALTGSVLIGQQGDGNGLQRGYPAAEYGDWTVRWRGQPGELHLGGTPCVERTELATSVDGIQTRVYTFTPTPNYCPSVFLYWNGTPAGPGVWTTTATEIAVTGPGIDPVNPPTFHPRALAKLPRGGSIRVMDSLNAIGGSMRDIGDYLTRERFSYFEPMRRVSVGVAEIRQYTGPLAPFNPENRTIIQVRTTTPHGVQDGQLVGLQGVGDATFSDGDVRDLGQNAQPVAIRVDDTTLLLEVARNIGGFPTMTNVITTGTLSYQVGGSAGNGALPLLVCIELCNELGCDLWLNTCNTVSDEAATWLGQQVAANLNAGLKVRFEFCNEPWNTIISRGYLTVLTSRLVAGSYDDPYPGYVKRAGEVFGLFKAAMAAAGRGADALLVMGTNGSNGGNTSSIIDNSRVYGVAFDVLAVAPYQDTLGPMGGYSPPWYDYMTPDQCLDCYEATIELMGLDGTVTSARQQLDAAATAIESTDPALAAMLRAIGIDGYEGGTDVLTPPGSLANYSERNYAAQRHPRMYWIFLRQLQKLQAAGMGRFHQYAFNIGLGKYQFHGSPSMAMWNACPGLTTRPGAGDLVAEASNLTDPLALDSVSSPIVGAMLRHASLVGTSGDVAAPTGIPSAVVVGTPTLSAQSSPGPPGGSIFHPGIFVHAGAPR